MKTITEAQATAGSAFNAVALDLGDLVTYSVQCDFSGATLAGTGKIQGSNTATTWVDVSGATQTIASAASILLSTVTAGYRYARFVWTPSGGSGTAAITAILKSGG